MKESEDRNRSSLTPWAVAFVAAYLLWALFVAVSGAGWNPLQRWWDFEVVGQLGDAFGGLSAAMASAAAFFTLRSLLEEREETRRLRAREEERDKSEAVRDAAQVARAAEEAYRDLELTFFRMLDLRQKVVEEVRYGDNIGVIALNNIRILMLNFSKPTLSNGYNKIMDSFGNILTRYFRFTYHILKFLDESFPFDRAYRYAAFLRAQLTDAEVFLLGLNAVANSENRKAFALIQKYAMLHTMLDDDRQTLGTEFIIDQSAFESPSSLAEQSG